MLINFDLNRRITEQRIFVKPINDNDMCHEIIVFEDYEKCGHYILLKIRSKRIKPNKSPKNKGIWEKTIA